MASVRRPRAAYGQGARHRRLARVTPGPRRHSRPAHRTCVGRTHGLGWRESRSAGSPASARKLGSHATVLHTVRGSPPARPVRQTDGPFRLAAARLARSNAGRRRLRRRHGQPAHAVRTEMRFGAARRRRDATDAMTVQCASMGKSWHESLRHGALQMERGRGFDHEHPRPHSALSARRRPWRWCGA